METIKNDSYWVLDKKLLGARKPTNIQEVDSLKAMGITGIISLLDDKENHDLYKEAKIDFQWTPVKGGTSPSKQQVLDAFSFIQSKWKSGEAIAIHCTGGKKRTGTMIVAALISSGMQFNEAIEKLNSANPDIKLSDGQLSFLKELN